MIAHPLSADFIKTEMRRILTAAPGAHPRSWRPNLRQGGWVILHLVHQEPSVGGYTVEASDPTWVGRAFGMDAATLFRSMPPESVQQLERTPATALRVKLTLVEHVNSAQEKFYLPRVDVLDLA